MVAISAVNGRLTVYQLLANGINRPEWNGAVSRRIIRPGIGWMFEERNVEFGILDKQMFNELHQELSIKWLRGEVLIDLQDQLENLQNEITRRNVKKFE